uniref:Uncharacterized protein n=1 Tax=Anguilla anguilla TaxID=7936 RepID=A0A0E9PF83_ANGAN
MVFDKLLTIYLLLTMI